MMEDDDWESNYSLSDSEKLSAEIDEWFTEDIKKLDMDNEIMIPDELRIFQETRILEVTKKVQENKPGGKELEIYIPYDTFVMIVMMMYKRCTKCKSLGERCYHIDAHTYGTLMTMSSVCKTWYIFVLRFLAGKKVILVDIDQRAYKDRVHSGFKERAINLVVECKKHLLMGRNYEIHKQFLTTCICYSIEWKTLMTKTLTDGSLKKESLPQDPRVLEITKGIPIKVEYVPPNTPLKQKDILTPTDVNLIKNHFECFGYLAQKSYSHLP